MTIKYCDRCGVRIIAGNSDVILDSVVLTVKKHSRNKETEFTETMDLCYNCANSFVAWTNSPLFKANPLHEIDINKEYTNENN